MNPLRGFHRPWLWLGLWCVLVIAVIVASLLPAQELPPAPFDHVDKLEHFLAYAVLSGYAVALFARRRTQALAALALIALGVALEVAQAQMTADRMPSSADALANALGALAGLLLAPTRWATALLRLEHRWFRL